MTLELIPNGDLVFKGPFNAVSITSLKLNNSGNERLAYKIKTTAPKRYCVKPNSGFLDAHANASVQVMLQPQAAGQPDDRNKHKFMVQWAAVPNDYTDDVDNFWKQDLKSLPVKDAKLKCIFADDQQAAVVPGDSAGHGKADAPTLRTADSTSHSENRVQLSSNKTEQQATPPSPATARTSVPLQAANQVRTQASNDDSDKTRVKQEIDSLKRENESLRERLKQQESTLRQRTTTNDRPASGSVDRLKANQQTGVALFGIALTEQLVLVAFVVALLFGFSLGYFLFSCGN